LSFLPFIFGFSLTRGFGLPNTMLSFNCISNERQSELVWKTSEARKGRNETDGWCLSSSIG